MPPSFGAFGVIAQAWTERAVHSIKNSRGLNKKQVQVEVRGFDRVVIGGVPPSEWESRHKAGGGGGSSIAKLLIID